MREMLAPVLGEATVQELRDACEVSCCCPATTDTTRRRALWNGAHDEPSRR